jgi:hypothetical protein
MMFYAMVAFMVAMALSITIGSKKRSINSVPPEELEKHRKERETRLMADLQKMIDEGRAKEIEPWIESYEKVGDPVPRSVKEKADTYLNSFGSS